MTDGNMNTGTKAVSLVLMGNELTAIISDARWLLIVILVCVVADFRYGWGARRQDGHARIQVADVEGAAQDCEQAGGLLHLGVPRHAGRLGDTASAGHRLHAGRNSRHDNSRGMRGEVVYRAFLLPSRRED